MIDSFKLGIPSGIRVPVPVGRSCARHRVRCFSSICLSLQFLPTGLWPARFHSPYINQVNESFHAMRFVGQTRRHRRCHAQRLMHLIKRSRRNRNSSGEAVPELLADGVGQAGETLHGQVVALDLRRADVSTFGVRQSRSAYWPLHTRTGNTCARGPLPMGLPYSFTSWAKSTSAAERAVHGLQVSAMTVNGDLHRLASRA